VNFCSFFFFVFFFFFFFLHGCYLLMLMVSRRPACCTTAYRLYTVVPRLLKFVDNLTNWYLRFNRKRLKVWHGQAKI
jgi:isoleucyl-tRNA synthetase